MTSFADSAVLTTLNMSKWEGWKYDPQLTKQFNADHGAQRGSSRINKLIVPKDWIDPCTRAFGQLYTYHKGVTMPWLDNGQRVLVSSLLFEFGEKTREYRYAIEQEVDRLDRTYTQMIAGQPQRMNGLFKITDYPPHSSLRSLFSVNIAFGPIPEADIRLKGVSAEELAQMNDSKEQEFKRAIQGTIDDQWQRIYKEVSHMSERMKAYSERELRKARGEKVDKTGTFNDSLVENLRNLVAVLPNLNFTNDPALTAMTRKLDSELCGFDPDELKENAGARVRVKKSAEQILKEMESYVGTANP